MLEALALVLFPELEEKLLLDLFLFVLRDLRPLLPCIS